MRIQFNHGVVLGHGRIAHPGEIVEMDEKVARVFIRHNQARLLPPAPVEEAPRKAPAKTMDPET
jgi:hypothetical protein